MEKSWAYRQDQLPSTHPVAADIPDLHAVEVNFDGITYAKGASVLKQLVAYVGLEAFLAGLRDYFRDHAFGNATFGDLLGALEKASGRDLSDWGRQWLKTTGLNTLRPDFDVDADGRFTRFAIAQSGAAPGAGETRVHRLAVGIYDDDGSGKLVRTHREELDVEGASTDVPALQGVSRGKLILVNDDDLTYCSLRLDPESLQTALTRIADIADPLPRTLAWSAAWEMTREAELKARDFVALVKQRRARRDRSRRGAAAAAAGADRARAPTPTRTGRPQTAGRRSPTALLDLARESPSRARITSWRSSTRCARRCCRRNHIAVLADAARQRTRGESDLPGLVIDTDLRWRIVTALAAGGDDRRRRHRDAVHRRRGAAGSDRGGQAATPRRPRRPDRRPRSRRPRGSR